MHKIADAAGLMRLAYDIGASDQPAVVRDSRGRHHLLGENRDGVLFSVTFANASASERDPAANDHPDATYENLGHYLRWGDADDLLDDAPLTVLHWPNGGPDAPLPKPDGVIVVGEHDGVPDRDIGQAGRTEAQLLAMAESEGEEGTSVFLTPNAAPMRLSVVRDHLLRLLAGKAAREDPDIGLTVGMTAPAMPRVFPMHPSTAIVVGEDMGLPEGATLRWDDLLQWAQGNWGHDGVEVLASSAGTGEDASIESPAGGVHGDQP